MTSKKEGDESEKYYDGYYWGNEPYSSRDLPGRQKDEELARDAVARLENLGLSKIQVRVSNAVAILTGTVQNYEQKRTAGVAVWKTPGIVKVSNNLYVQNADTSGPAAQ